MEGPRGRCLCRVGRAGCEAVGALFEVRSAAGEVVALWERSSSVTWDLLDGMVFAG